ncbi:MAG: tRNA pseudouridine(38-40) synthase TruA [Lachnospiraceae bacterium]|nr:tRNA pseudouridine(38-40) synthase TruA [Lachnospiraceae bacterium]
MANFCLLIQYDGSRYNGWQRQGNTQNTIQEKLETILETLYGEPIDLNGSGRTDAGVHALCQVANFKIPRILSRYSCQEIQQYMNDSLPKDIRILGVEKADDRFHARLSAISKIYEYRIDCGEVANIFDRRYLVRIEEPLDFTKMREAADYLTGEHDFKSFCDNRQMKKSTIRTIHDISLELENGILTIRYHGNGFLYHMVRILTGTLLEVGIGDLLPSRIPSILEARDRSMAGFTAPPQGLFLIDVFYE